MTFREWLRDEEELDPDYEGTAHDRGWSDAMTRAIEEFDSRFTVATLEELATSTGTIWIEEEPDDE